MSLTAKSAARREACVEITISCPLLRTATTLYLGAFMLDIAHPRNDIKPAVGESPTQHAAKASACQGCI